MLQPRQCILRHARCRGLTLIIQPSDESIQTRGGLMRPNASNYESIAVEGQRRLTSRGGLRVAALAASELRPARLPDPLSDRRTRALA